MTELDQKSFTSWKLDLMRAIMMAPELEPNEARVAFCLAQHASSATKAIYPAQATLADEACMKERQVRALIARLVQKGWLRIYRPNRQRQNSYSFIEANVQRVFRWQEELKAKRDERRTLARTGSSVPVRNELTGAIAPLATGSSVPVQTGSIAPLNTSIEHQSGNTINMGVDKKDSEVGVYARETSYVPPDFDALEFEQQERHAKSRRRVGAA